MGTIDKETANKLLLDAKNEYQKRVHVSSPYDSINLISLLYISMGIIPFIGVTLDYFDNHKTLITVMFADALAVLFMVIGIGMKKRKYWVVIPAYVTSILFLLAIPIGTIFGVWTITAIRRARDEFER